MPTRMTALPRPTRPAVDPQRERREACGPGPRTRTPTYTSKVDETRLYHRESDPVQRAPNRYLTVALFAAVVVLLVEVLLEAWVQELRSDRTVDARGVVVGDLPDWPKQLKNGLLLVVAALTATKFGLERRWRELTTRADLALVVLVAVMVVAGLLGTSGLTLTAQAVFVYLRGAIVFYAVRALRPTWPQIRRVLVVVGCVVGAGTVVSLVQLVAGPPAYSGVGWVDLTWAGIHRAHGLFDHPNHLGHVLGLVLIGLVAWMSGPAPQRSVQRSGHRSGHRWAVVAWLAFGGAALGLAASQSRESMLATVAAAALIWYLRRGGGRTVLIASTVIVVLFAGHLVARPGNVDELLRRLRGVVSAVDTPSGHEQCAEFATIGDCVAAGGVAAREIRMLFFQQGGRLVARRPLLGYGVGQFGGIVAEQHDPRWEQDPRFRQVLAPQPEPGGFQLYGFDGTTVDSFWLHLTVETGVVGLIAYLAWLWLIAVPLLGVTPRFAGRTVWGAGRRARGSGGARDPTAEAVALWGIGTLLFTILVGVFSPALEDPLFPPLVFAILGTGWVLTGQRSRNPEGPGSEPWAKTGRQTPG
jgi:hypothetical protein